MTRQEKPAAFSRRSILKLANRLRSAFDKPPLKVSTSPA